LVLSLGLSTVLTNTQLPWIFILVIDIASRCDVFVFFFWISFVLWVYTPLMVAVAVITQ
jgi:hypothetical protein